MPNVYTSVILHPSFENKCFQMGNRMSSLIISTPLKGDVRILLPSQYST